MIGMKSRLAAMLASAAALSLSATPALAQGWGGGWGHHRHRDRVDAGDVLAGILIIGGIAAIASAASSHKGDRSEDRRDDERPEYPRDRAANYGGNDNDRQWEQNAPQNIGVDSAVSRCVGEVSHGSNRGTSVESINRDGDGWRVQGQTGEGAYFTCSVDGSGQIRNVQVDDRAH